MVDKEITLGPEHARLMRYALKLEKQWLVNGEDCIPTLDDLAEAGLIERHENGKKWRLG